MQVRLAAKGQILSLLAQTSWTSTCGLMRLLPLQLRPTLFSTKVEEEACKRTYSRCYTLQRRTQAIKSQHKAQGGKSANQKVINLQP
jgi:hypothetical protein